jgi:hypothetical protein
VRGYGPRASTNSVLVLGEHPVEDDEVVVEVGVEAGAEPV